MVVYGIARCITILSLHEEFGTPETHTHKAETVTHTSIFLNRTLLTSQRVGIGGEKKSEREREKTANDKTH